MNCGLDISHMCMVTHQVTKKPVFVSVDYMHVHYFFLAERVKCCKKHLVKTSLLFSISLEVTFTLRFFFAKQR